MVDFDSVLRTEFLVVDEGDISCGGAIFDGNDLVFETALGD